MKSKDQRIFLEALDELEREKGICTRASQSDNSRTLGTLHPSKQKYDTKGTTTARPILRRLRPRDY